MSNCKLHRTKADGRHQLVTSLANGFDFETLNWKERKWLRMRRLVNQTGLVTDKGHRWARELLAAEADRLMAGNAIVDFEE